MRFRIVLTADRSTEDGAEAATAATVKVRDLTDESVARTPLVGLLFGIKSPTAEAGARMVDALAEATGEAEMDKPDLDKVREHGHSAADELQTFTITAHTRLTRWRWRLPRG